MCYYELFNKCVKKMCMYAFSSCHNAVDWIDFPFVSVVYDFVVDVERPVLELHYFNFSFWFVRYDDDTGAGSG